MLPIRRPVADVYHSIAPPGMRVEYGVGRATVALLWLSALLGTAAGSFVWGALADLYGRRASILLSSVMFSVPAD
jgi:MFS transporter, putative metabolite:H+ symporter